MSGQIKVTVDRLGMSAEGHVLVQGQHMFVPMAIPGDHVVMQQDQQGNNHVVAIEQGPMERQQNICRHLADCGGCVAQHLSAQLYQQWKLDKLHTVLQQNGLGQAKVLPIWSTPPATRRRASFTWDAAAGVLGFCQKKSHVVTDIAACQILTPELMAGRLELQGLMRQAKIFDQVKDVFVQQCQNGLDVTIAMGGRSLSAAVLGALSGMNWPEQVVRVMVDAEPVMVRAQPVVQFGTVSVPVAPMAFLQATAEGQEKIVQTVKSFLRSKGKVAELFAGYGTLTFPLSANYQVIAFESDAQAVTTLQKMAAGHSISVQRRDLFRYPVQVDELKSFQQVVMDPPRAGAHAQSIMLGKSTIKTIVYVSCQPASFVKDALVLQQAGFQLQHIQPIDQFLWSDQLELVAAFSR